MEHTAALRGIWFARSLQQEASDYYRALTPALERLVSASRMQGGSRGLSPRGAGQGGGPMGNRTGGCGGTGVFGNAGEGGVGGD